MLGSTSAIQISLNFVVYISWKSPFQSLSGYPNPDIDIEIDLLKKLIS